VVFVGHGPVATRDGEAGFAAGGEHRRNGLVCKKRQHEDACRAANRMA
jgi:hypothetical protein